MLALHELCGLIHTGFTCLDRTLNTPAGVGYRAWPVATEYDFTTWPSWYRYSLFSPVRTRMTLANAGVRTLANVVTAGNVTSGSPC